MTPLNEVKWVQSFSYSLLMVRYIFHSKEKGRGIAPRDISDASFSCGCRLLPAKAETGGLFMVVNGAGAKNFSHLLHFNCTNLSSLL